MTAPVYFHGDRQDQQDFLAAHLHNCTCVIDEKTAVRTQCPSCVAMVTDQHYVDGLEFGRWRHLAMTAEEWMGMADTG